MGREISLLCPEKKEKGYKLPYKITLQHFFVILKSVVDNYKILFVELYRTLIHCYNFYNYYLNICTQTKQLLNIFN